MATKRFSSRCTRHVDVKLHVVRDAVESDVVQIHYFKSKEQYANVLTKALGVNNNFAREIFAKCVGRIDDGLG